MDNKALYLTVILALLFIIPGFILGKLKIVKENHLSSLSAILVYVCTPCIIIPSFMKIEYTVDNLLYMLYFFIASLVIQIIFMLIIFIVLKRKYDNPNIRVFNIASTLGNTGFFGLPVITALIPSVPLVAAYSGIYVVTMNILVFTMGTFCLTNDKKHMTIKKAFINPSFISLVIAIPLFIFKVKQFIPDTLFNGADLLGKMSTPLCMIILGVRLSELTFKYLFLRFYPYLVALFKLIVFPLFAYLCVYFIPIDASFKASIFILSATPCAAVILNMAEMYNGEKELAANSVLITTLLCVITIPLLTLILNATLNI